MRKNFRKLVSLGLVVLLITAGSASPVVAEEQQCTTADKVTTVINAASLFTLSTADSAFGDGSVNKAINDCINQKTQQEIDLEALQNETDTQTKIQIYETALATKQKQDEFDTVFNNYLQDSKSVAWMYAENAVAEAYQNGSSKAIAESKAKQAINDYYSTKQVNFIESRESSLLTWYNLKNRSVTEGYQPYAFPYNQTSGDTFDLTPVRYRKVRKVNYSVELYNGTTIQTTKVEYSYNSDTGTILYEFAPTFVSGAKDGQDGQDYTSYSLAVSPPTSDYDDYAIAYDGYDTRQKYNKLTSTKSQINSKTEEFVNKTYDAFQNGKIDASDVTSRNTKIFTKGIEGNESYADLLAAYANMGLETPELNGTGTVTMEYQGNTYEGMIFGNAPNGSWKTQTYNTQTINGTVSFVSTDAKQFPVTGEFTITRITNKEGNEIQEVNVTKYNYVTTNSSEYERKLDKILELYNESESREQQLINGPGNTRDAPQINLPDWLESELFGIPLWGILGIGGIGIYAVSVARREN